MDRAQSERLIHLWKHRGNFQTEAEWTELYRLVHLKLMTCNAPILLSLPDTREYYIQDFFLYKVLETAGRNTTPLHSAGALCTFFRNFLIDDHRRQAPEDTVASSEGEGDEPPLIEQIGFMPVEEKLDPARDAIEYGVTLEQARHSARQFLLSLMGWLPIILARKFCADLDVAKKTIHLAKELGAVSPSHNLEKLGVTKRHGSAGNPDFPNTQLGKWIASLGVEPIQENAACMQWLFVQLCHEAQVMDQEETQQ